jgi:hypothetical protein
VLTKVFNLKDVYDTAYMLWYTREASVAVYVANLPLIWPLLREWIPILRNATSLHSKTLPTVEPPLSKNKVQERIISMNAYHKNSGGTSSLRTLTRESQPQTPDPHSSPDEKETAPRSLSTRMGRSTSRGRTRTKSTLPSAETPPHMIRSARRFSGESHWDGLITAETTIQVDEQLLGELENGPDERHKFMVTPPPSLKFEAEQEQRSNSQVKIQGGAPSPPAFSGDRRSRNMEDSPSVLSHNEHGPW